MNKIVVLFALLAVSTAGFLGSKLVDQNKALEKQAAELKTLRTQLASTDADNKVRTAANSELEVKLKEMGIVLTQSKTELTSAQQRIKQLDEMTEAEKSARFAKEQELRRAMTQIAAPSITFTTNSAGGEVRTVTFDKLISRNGQVIASKAEFLSVDGRKVFFKYGSGGGSVDVDTLHLGVLAHLGIDPDAAKQMQAKLDVQRTTEDNLRLQAAAQRIAFYEKLKNERRETDAKIAAQKATELAAMAEAERQKKQAENERMQAEAAKKQADAAMLQATRPPDYNYNPNYTGVSGSKIP